MNPSIPGGVIVGFVLRWVVTLAAGFAVGHHIIDTSQVSAFVQDGIAAIPALAMLAWSYRSWAKAEFRTIAAAVTGLIHPAVKDAGVMAQVAASPKVTAAVAASAASAAAKLAIVLFLVVPMSGLLTACAQVANAEALIAQNAARIKVICDKDVVPAAAEVPDILGEMVPIVGTMKAASLGACAAIDTVAQSASTGAWLQTAVTVMRSKGTKLPAPVAPVPIVAPTAFLVRHEERLI